MPLFSPTVANMSDTYKEIYEATIHTFYTVYDIYHAIVYAYNFEFLC